MRPDTGYTDNAVPPRYYKVGVVDRNGNIGFSSAVAPPGGGSDIPTGGLYFIRLVTREGTGWLDRSSGLGPPRPWDAKLSANPRANAPLHDAWRDGGTPAGGKVRATGCLPG